MNSKVVAVIPARKCSKRLPGKNKRLFCGKPLVCWTVDEALKCDFIDEIIVSTDDEDIMGLFITGFEIDGKGYRYNNKAYKRLSIIKRPEELAQDDTPMWKVITHALKGYDRLTIIFLLQPTSPLRTAKDIEKGFACFLLYKSCLSGYWLDAKTVRLNGAVYINYLVEIDMNHRLYGHNPTFYMMGYEESIDIDTLEDFKLAEKMMEERL